VTRKTLTAEGDRPLINLTHETTFIRDLRGDVIFWNKSAAEMYGWSHEEVLGKPSHVLLRTIFPVPLPEVESAVLRTGEWQGELIHTKRDGSTITVASHWALLRDKHGEPLAILETK
jgi:PAS domain S-box-containing protein